MSDSDACTRTIGLNLIDRSYIIKAWIPDLVSPFIFQSNRVAQSFIIVVRSEGCGPGCAKTSSDPAAAADGDLWYRTRDRTFGVAKIEAVIVEV